MAISTFAELKAKMRRLLAEQDTNTFSEDDIEDCIQFLEEDLNEDPEFRLREMNRVVFTNPLQKDDPFIELPPGFLSMRYIEEQNNESYPPLTYLAPSAFAAKNQQGFLRYYTVINNQIKIKDNPSGGEILEQSYYEKLPALSDSNPSNFLLVKSSRLYLYGSLVHAEAFLDNDPRIATWKGLFEEAKAKLIEADEQSVTAAGSLEIQLPERVA